MLTPEGDTRLGLLDIGLEADVGAHANKVRQLCIRRQRLDEAHAHEGAGVGALNLEPLVGHHADAPGLGGVRAKSQCTDIPAVAHRGLRPRQRQAARVNARYRSGGLGGLALVSTTTHHVADRAVVALGVVGALVDADTEPAVGATGTVAVE